MSWPTVLDAVDATYETAIRRQTGPPVRHPAVVPG
jgi:hypothetical protein